MKKPERMKNKTTKAFLYQNLYPVNLYVTTLDDWEDACDFFDFFLTTKELRNDEPERDRPKLSSVMGATFLVREKYSRAVGILIVLDDLQGAKKYGENTWQYLDNGYERYKGALLRHLYRAENETFDEDTGCRHLAQVAWNAIALLWLSKQDTYRSRANESNEELEDLFHEFIKEEEICTYNHDNRREAGQNSVESRSDVDVYSTDIKRIK